MSLPVPPAPHAHPPASAGDAFACVQAAVLHGWATVRDHEAGPTSGERNLMLDVCGSDHRPLVDLVLDLGRTLRPALLASRARDESAPMSHAAWTTLRAAHVHRIVATRYLQHDVARWAVDVWGAALGLAPRIEAASPRPVEAMSSARDGGTVAPAAAATAPPPATARANTRPPTPSAGTVRTPASRLGVPPSAVPAALRQVPSWAGGPVSFGVGQTPKASTLAALAARGRVVVQHGHTGPIGPMWHPAERRAALVFAALLTVCGGSLWVALEGRRDAATRPVVPAASAVDSVARPVAPATASNAPVAASGRTPTTDVASDTASPSTDATAPAAIGYNLVPLPAARDEGAVSTGRVLAVRDRGVAGRYRVEQRIRDVSGTENCDAVARALGAGRVTEEVIAHVAGAREFTLTTRGVKGTLTADGFFVAEPSAGSMNNVAWQFRMRGRFTPDGFVGESETLTDAIIRWGRQQTCVVTADLTATRLTSGAS